MTLHLTPAQIRAALGLLGWSQNDLAEKIGATPVTIGRILLGHNKPQEKTEESIRRVFNERVEFTDNQGVKFKPIGVEIFEGPERFEDYYAFLYAHLEQYGGEVCVSCTNEFLFREHRTPEAFDNYKQRMKSFVESGKISLRVLATKSNFTSTWAQYRWQPEQSAAPTAFYAFGDCLALISFDHDPAPYVVLHKSGPFAETYRNAFNVAWQLGKKPPKEEKE